MDFPIWGMSSDGGEPKEEKNMFMTASLFCCSTSTYTLIALFCLKNKNKPTNKTPCLDNGAIAHTMETSEFPFPPVASRPVVEHSFLGFKQS